MENEMISISKKEYKELLEDSIFLSFLQEAGVDNWDGYSEACKLEEEYLKEM